jgi:HKD family nuclease
MGLTARFVPSNEIAQSIQSLSQDADSVDIAIAYLKMGGYEFIREPILRLIRAGKSCRMAVGLANYHITAPDAVYKLLDLRKERGGDRCKLRYSSRTGFHAKVFYFRGRDSSRSLLAGSSNLTSGGIHGGNLEANLLVSGTSDEEIFKDIERFFARVMSNQVTGLLTETRAKEYELDWLKHRPKTQGRKSSLKATPPASNPPGSPDTDEESHDDTELVRLERAKGDVFWKISPGEGAWQWTEWKKQTRPDNVGLIAVGWIELGNPIGLEWSEIAERAESNDYLGWYVANQLTRFRREMMEGDYVLAYGHNSILGVGRLLDSVTTYRPGNPELYPSRRRVKWLNLDRISLTKSQRDAFMYPRDTLHTVPNTKIPREVRRIIARSKAAM